MLKCNFKKSAAYFQNTFYWQHLSRATSEKLLRKSRKILRKPLVHPCEPSTLLNIESIANVFNGKYFRTTNPENVYGEMVFFLGINILATKDIGRIV